MATATEFASSDVHRSRDATLPSVPMKDDRRSWLGVSVVIR